MNATAFRDERPKRRGQHEPNIIVYTCIAPNMLTYINAPIVLSHCEEQTSLHVIKIS